MSPEKLVKAARALVEAGESGLTKAELAGMMDASEKAAQNAVALLKDQDAVIDQVKVPGEHEHRYVLRNDPDWLIRFDLDLMFEFWLLRELTGYAPPAMQYLVKEAMARITPRQRIQFEALKARVTLTQGRNLPGYPGGVGPEQALAISQILKPLLGVFATLERLRMVQLVTPGRPGWPLAPISLVVISSPFPNFYLLGQEAPEAAPELVPLAWIQRLQVLEAPVPVGTPDGRPSKDLLDAALQRLADQERPPA